jgi:hypothetical protein
MANNVADSTVTVDNTSRSLATLLGRPVAAFVREITFVPRAESPPIHYRIGGEAGPATSRLPDALTLPLSAEIAGDIQFYASSPASMDVLEVG